MKFDLLDLEPRLVSIVWLTVALLLVPGTTAGQEREVLAAGQEIYRTHCASCHDDPRFRAPPAAALGTMSQEALLASLTTGSMAAVAESLDVAEKKSLIVALRREPWSQRQPPANLCRRPPESLSPIRWSGWGGGPGSLGSRSDSTISPETVQQLRVVWAFGFPAASRVRSQPAIVGTLLVVGSQLGEVYGLDRVSGCTHWVFRAPSSVRGAISLHRSQGRVLVLFADFLGHVFAVDAKSGKEVWQTRVQIDPFSSVTGSVTVVSGKVLVPIASTEVVAAATPEFPCCTSTGGVVALDVESGERLWSYRTISEEARTAGSAGAPVWSSPTVDLSTDTVFVGTGQNYTRPTTETSDAIVALDLASGAVRWIFQGTSGDAFNLSCVMSGENCPAPPNPDVDFGMSPLIVERDAGTLLLAGQKSGVVHALNPASGALIWQRRVGIGGPNGGIHWGMAVAGERLLVPVSDRPSNVEGIDPVGVPRPGLQALSISTGELLWSEDAPRDTCAGRTSCYAAYSAAPTAAERIVFVGGLDGVLRGYDTGSGKPVWSWDTKREQPTSNGTPGQGGAIDGPGPVIVGDMLYALSGYGMNSQMPGNLLLAFRLSEE